MRDIELSSFKQVRFGGTLLRGLRLALCGVGVCLILTSGVAQAQDDDDEQPEQTFEEGIISNLLRGLGGTNIDNAGINYRERSPLVVPPKLNLPPPATRATPNSPNWPKDPDVAERKARIELSKQPKVFEARPLTPSELAVRPTRSRASASAEVQQPGATPGTNEGMMLSPSQLGYKGGLFGLFGSKKEEAEAFKGEPTRGSLTQPPVGYQTPSPKYSYGTGAAPVSR